MKVLLTSKKKVGGDDEDDEVDDAKNTENADNSCLSNLEFPAMHDSKNFLVSTSIVFCLTRKWTFKI